MTTHSKKKEEKKKGASKLRNSSRVSAFIRCACYQADHVCRYMEEEKGILSDYSVARRLSGT
jgi:hypothetical protein